MPNPLFFPKLVLTSTLVAFAMPAQAQPEGPPAEDRNQLVIGVGGGIGPSYDGSDDYKFQPGGLVQGKVDGFDFAMRGLNLYVDLVRERPDSKVNVSIGPVAQLRLERTGGIKDARVALLGERDAAIELGGYVGVAKRGLLNPYDSLGFDVSYVHDVAGTHKSYIVKPSVTYFTPLSRRNVALLSLSADYVGAGYGRTYFDVPVIVAAGPTLSGYATSGAGFKSAGATLLLTQALGADARKGWSLFALSGYTKLLGQYKRSPIVSEAGAPNQFLGVVGIAYSF